MKWIDLWHSFKQNKVVRRIGRPLKRIWKTAGRHLPMKLISLLLAILFWNYVITSNTSITRTKTLTGVNGYLSGRASLTNNGLALLEDPSDQLKNLTVVLDVPQASYSRVSAGNVQVLLDVTNVRSAGEQEVALKATAAYGRVLSVKPATVSLNFEMLDSRSVPINSYVKGNDLKNKWCNVTRLNPQSVTISGAASIVQNVASACVYVDADTFTESTIKALPYVLLDAAGNEIPQNMLTRSSSTVSAMVDVYPVKELPINTESAINGTLPEGYRIVSVEAQPESVTIAADQDLLDDLDVLNVSPVSVEDMTQSFSANVSVITLSDFRYISNEEVYLNITIEKEE